MPTPNLEYFIKNPFNPNSDDDWKMLRAAAQNIFDPKSPIDDGRLFSGRFEQIDDILDAVYEKGGHAMIFGERGVGKTSLANILSSKVAPILQDLRVLHVDCGTGDDFYTIWGNAFNDFEAGPNREERPADYFRRTDNPYEIYNAIKDLDSSKYHIIIFDEFDRIKDEKTLYQMGDLIKYFSNHPQNVTIIIVGVGETLTDLFLGHESIERCVSQVKMPRMSYKESKAIITERIPKIGFSITEDVQNGIIKLSQGMPGYVHLLGRLTLRAAIERRSTSIDKEDFKIALTKTLDKTDQRTREDYYRAVSSPNKDNKYKEVLLACAMAKSNELGHFYAGDIREPYSLIRGKPMEITNYATNLSNLCKDERGALVKTGTRKLYQYRFKNPLLQPLVMMIGVHEGMIEMN